jgi:chemotaxis protein methyltransferase CheR
LIYFDQSTKIEFFSRLKKVMEPDGFLALGAAETVVGLTEAFRPHPDRRGLYRPSSGRPSMPLPVFGAYAQRNGLTVAGP